MDPEIVRTVLARPKRANGKALSPDRLGQRTQENQEKPGKQRARPEGFEPPTFGFEVGLPRAEGSTSKSCLGFQA
ncbi:MAG: hypothetical protein AMJ78_10815 [Omnitrophica WOR_2 bacterium SM23_29]|nr:MAG: hypothetical protein AMJ78_10815 [Omnitrophica WOR_2 bacterium SM23_29]